MLNNLRVHFKTELKKILGDKSLILMLFVAPVFYLFFYGSLYLNKVEKELPVAIVDYDQSAASRALIRMFDATDKIEIDGNFNSVGEAESGFKSGEIRAYIIIPANFETGIKKGKGSDIKVYLNNTRFLPSNDIAKAVSEVTLTMGAGIRLNYLEIGGLSKSQALNVVQPIGVDMRSINNTTDSYGDFLIPGIFILILQQTLLIGLGESLGKDRENKELQNISLTWITGKSLPYLIMFFAYSVLFYTVPFHTFSLTFKGSLLILLGVTPLFLMVVILFGYLAGSFFKSKFDALIILAFTSYPVFLISGYSWPLSAMPDQVRMLSYLIPSTPFLNIYTKVTQFGADLNMVLPQIGHLLILLIVYSVLLLFRYKILSRPAVTK